MNKREIKFRFWNKLQKKMEDEVFFGDFEGETIVHEQGLNEAFKIAAGTAYEVMQYTGLKDKNGVEIYEGDIVVAFGKETETTTGEKRIVVDDAFNSYVALRDCIIDGENPEVIGNIYENPELLK